MIQIALEKYGSDDSVEDELGKGWEGARPKAKRLQETTAKV